MEKEEVQTMAFEMIADAGEAMNSYYNAMISYHRKNFEKALEELERGNLFLVNTHLIQTRLIQAEVNNETIPYSLVMCHAQDHLSNAINWQRLCTLFIKELEEGEDNE